MLNLSILTVNWNSSEYLNTNIEHIVHYNGFIPNWIAVDNSDNPDNLDERFTVIPGIRQNTWDPNEHRNILCGSIHHSLGIHAGLPHIGNPNYLLVLDPDFYICRPLESILKEMQENNYAFMGAAYSNKLKPLYDKFPAAFCMFIDLNQIDINQLNFKAGFNEHQQSMFKNKIYPDVGWKIGNIYKKSELKYTWSNNSHRDDIDCVFDYYKSLNSFHLRCKLHHPDKRLANHRKFFKRLLNGEFNSF